ncbi:MAG: hypothetical protein D6696_04940 [Acidobacteria bacterium]|nr:MAG: hypothetical protein D6696_04940 [Acidobacteriota bacterium]
MNAGGTSVWARKPPRDSGRGSPRRRGAGAGPSTLQRRRRERQPSSPRRRCEAPPASGEQSPENQRSCGTFPAVRPAVAEPSPEADRSDGSRRDVNKPSSSSRRDYRDWYSISVAAMRRWLVLGALLVFAGVAFLVLRQWQKYDLQMRAVRAVEQGEQLIEEIEEREDSALLRADNLAAWENLDKARQALIDGDYALALDRGSASVRQLQGILQKGEGSIRFMTVAGNVEYRRGERGAWKRAREVSVLDPGDWVKTGSDGTAEILLGDGSTYTVRPNTMILLGGDKATERGGGEGVSTVVEFGLVDLSTAARASRVATPQAQARVSRDSQASIFYDRDAQRARFALFKGEEIEVRSTDGEVQTIGPLQQVEQVADRLGPTKALPAPPQLLNPVDDQEVDLDAVQRLTLAWQPAPRAARYHLRVSENRLFASNVIEDRNRRKTSATLGLRREGSFYWQVAGIGSNGEHGPWSEPRAFRVAALSSVGLVADDVPPPLEVEEIQTYGSLVIVKGRTEPGARVRVDDEQALVGLDGAFDKTIQIKREGWATVEIVATDAAGNETRKRGRVHIEGF